MASVTVHHTIILSLNTGMLYNYCAQSLYSDNITYEPRGSSRNEETFEADAYEVPLSAAQSARNKTVNESHKSLEATYDFPNTYYHEYATLGPNEEKV